MRRIWSGRNSQSCKRFQKKLFFEILESRRVRAGLTESIGDIEQAPIGSSPGGFVGLGDKIFFSAEDGLAGRELWMTDGTTARTEMVVDINPGSNSSDPFGMIAFGDHVFFVANHPTYGRELWKSDGTAAGTQMVADVAPGIGSSSPDQLAIMNGRLYFNAFGAQGRELWATDGTAEGTSQVADIYAGTNSSSPQDLTVANGWLYFSATTASSGRELWRSDGTAERTVMVKDIVPGNGSSNPSRVHAAVDRLYFVAETASAGFELWTSDGFSEGTMLVKDIRAGSNSSSPEQLVVFEGVLFFSAFDDATGRELWRSDGTADGTSIVADLFPGGTNHSNPSGLVVVNDHFYFSANASGLGQELWKSDGSAQGTMMVADIRSGSSSSDPRSLRKVNNSVFFSASDEIAGRELWKSDGTSQGTMRVADISSGESSSDPSEFVSIESRLFFSAISLLNGREPWVTDGTLDGTMILKEVNQNTFSSTPEAYFDDGGTIYFSATTLGHGRELWITDGPSTTTRLLLDSNIYSSHGNPTEFVSLDDKVYFASTDTWSGRELWRTDGTPEGTEMVTDLSSGPLGSNPNQLLVFQSRLFFVASTAANGTELWSSNGTSEGTSLIADIRPGSASSSPSQLTVVDDQLFFTASTEGEGRELWVTDGTLLGTRQVRDIRSGSVDGGISSLTSWTQHLLFAANDGVLGSELWISDGTELGTRVFADIQSGLGSSTPGGFLTIAEQVFFAATTAATGRELWRINNLEAGPELVSDLFPGSASSSPNQLTKVNGKFFFQATTANGTELWKSDGSSNGTSLVKDIRPGSASSQPNSLTAAGGRLYFVANDGELGAELWSSDGMLEGTNPVIDLRSGQGSSPSQLRSISGNGLVFSADDGQHGIEGWYHLVDDSPSNVYLSGSYVEERRGIGTPVGILHTVDSTENDAFRYTFAIGQGDSDNGYFAIDGDRIVLATELDYEAQGAYSIRVKTMDQTGNSFEKRLTIRAMDVNDPPDLQSVETVRSAGINASYPIHYDSLLEWSDAQDQDGDTIQFLVRNLSAGTLTKNGLPVILGETTLGPSEVWVWTPPTDGLGVIHAFDIVAWDGLIASTTSVPVAVEVLPWTLFASFEDSEINEAGPSEATSFTIRRVGDLTTPLLVTIESDESEIDLPDSIILPSGQSQLTVPVWIVNDGETDGSQFLLLKATATDYPETTANLVVHDDDRSDQRTIGGALAGVLVTSRYVVTQNLSVRAARQLTIEPGTELRFTLGLGFAIPADATVHAVGSEQAPIVFTSDAIVPMAGDWDGIAMRTVTSQPSILENVEIAFAKTGLRNRDFDRARFELLHSKIHDILEHGVDLDVGYGQFLSEEDARIIGNQFRMIGQTGVRIIARGISGSTPRSGSNLALVEGNEISSADVAISVVSSYATAGGFAASAFAGPSLIGNWLHNNRIGIAGIASRPPTSFGSSWVGGRMVNNLIHDHSEGGIQFLRSSGTLSPQVVNNSIIGNESYGVSHAALVPSASIRNNNIALNGVGISLIENQVPEVGQVAYNNVWGNDLDWVQYPATYGTAVGFNAHGTPIDAFANIQQDPLFMGLAEKDYRLRVISPLIDAGIEDQSPLTDFDGLVRLGGPDIGAFEKHSLAAAQIILSSQAFNENLPAGWEVAILSSIDPDVDDVHTYSLVAGNGDEDNSRFSLLENRLFFNETADFERQSSYSIRVQSADFRGQVFQQSLILEVLDLPEVQSVVVGDGSLQRSLVSQISILFDGLVSIEPEAISVIRRGVHQGFVGVNIQSQTNSQDQTLATLTFSGVHTRSIGFLVDGNYELSIDSSKVHRNTIELDGDLNGVAGGVFQLGNQANDRLFALYGDLDGDRLVNLIEFNTFRLGFGRLRGEVGYLEELDFEGDGTIALGDFNEFRRRFGRRLVY